MTGIDTRVRALSQALDRAETILAVHYASGNLFLAKDSPVKVTGISVTNLADESTEAFSMATIRGDSHEERELQLLKDFYQFMAKHQDAKIVHWNMDKADYGFGAIAARYRWLAGSDPVVTMHKERLFDLDQILTDHYGEGYVPHQKLPNLAALNRVNKRYWLSGKDEADAAENANFSGIQRSTSEKSRAIAHLLKKFLDGSLVTQESAGAVEFAGSQVDAVKAILALAGRMLLVERSLKRRHSNRATLEVSDEYDVQDLLRSLLVIFFEDVREETWAPEYAGGSTRVDFTLPEFRIAIEVKMARDSMTSRTLGEELIVDRDKYATHPEVSHLVCVVMDHGGKLANPRGVERDLSRDVTAEGIAVTARIFDR